MAKKDPDVVAYERLLEAPPDGHGFTKTQIAEILGITKQAITRWKAIPIRYVVAIHKATGIPKKDLLPSAFS